MDRVRIACPSCAATYEVPDRLIAGPPRALRCSRCGTEFMLPGSAAETPPPPAETAPAELPPPAAPDPPEVPPAEMREPEPAPEVPPDPPPSVTPERARAPLAAEPRDAALLRRAWIASLAVVGGAVVALLLLRAEIMQAWPPATRLFSALGLA